jgi:hypothetical protein
MLNSEESISPHKSIFKPATTYTQPPGLNKTFDGTVLDKGKEIFYTPYNNESSKFRESYS